MWKSHTNKISTINGITYLFVTHFSWWLWSGCWGSRSHSPVQTSFHGGVVFVRMKQGHTAFCAKWFAITGSCDRLQQSASFFYSYCSGTKHVIIMTQSNLKLHIRCFLYGPCWIDSSVLREWHSINFKGIAQHFGKLAYFHSPNSDMSRYTWFNYQCLLFYYPGFQDK